MVCETNEQNKDDTNLLQSNGSFYEGNPEAMMACLDGMPEESQEFSMVSYVTDK